VLASAAPVDLDLARLDVTHGAVADTADDELARGALEDDGVHAVGSHDVAGANVT
jgi:hypothetical protein